jgi:hypothetical protein
LANVNFQVEYSKWLKQFDSEDKNCLLKQVQNMLFETLIYRCILKARSIAPKDNKGRIRLNGAMHYLIDKCFFNNQLMAIRRLTDRGEDVVSLYKLLNQMKGNCKYLTRLNYFMILQERGYEYDYSEIKKKHDEYVEKNLRMNEAIMIPDELTWEKSERLHSDFDKLSKNKASNRTPEDIIDNSIFDKLLNELDRCEKLRDHVDHFVAHSLKPEKVEKLDDEALRVTFERLWEAQQIICKVTHFVGLYLLGIVDYGLLPIPHGSFLQYIEEPLITKEEKPKLREEEDIFRNEIYSWKIKIADF